MYYNNATITFTFLLSVYDVLWPELGGLNALYVLFQILNHPVLAGIIYISLTKALEIRDIESFIEDI